MKDKHPIRYNEERERTLKGNQACATNIVIDNTKDNIKMLSCM
jgi:hypothetical protein